MDLKPIVLYYSRTGRTEKLARLIAKDMQTEIIRVDCERSYSRRFGTSVSRVLMERMKKKHPTYITPVPDLTGFDPVFIGFPVWANDMPEFFADFLSQCRLKGKTVIPFATFGATGIGGALKTVSRVTPGAKVVLPFEDGTLRGGDYRKWRHCVRKLIWDLDD